MSVSLMRSIPGSCRLAGQAPILAGRGADGVAGRRRHCHPDLWLPHSKPLARLHRSERG
jgi:hypothetical protein